MYLAAFPVLIRNLYLHPCTAIWAGSNEPASPKFLSSLSHRGQSHATAIDRRHANPVINDLNAHLLSTSEANHARTSMCMACYISQGLLHHAIAGHLDCGWQRRKLLWCIEGEGNATHTILRELLLDS